MIFFSNQKDQEAATILFNHPLYQATFTTKGLAFMPSTGAPEFSWSIIGEDVAEPVSKGDRVVYQRKLVREEYVIRKNTIEQQFVLEKAPDLTMPLIIRGQISSNGNFNRLGSGWQWSNDIGFVSFSNVYAFDANGKTIPATMHVTANESRIEIQPGDLQSAVYPVTIDPEIGTDFRITTFGSAGDIGSTATTAAITYHAAAQKYLVVWEGNDGGDVEIWGKFLNRHGNPVGSNFRISNMGNGSAAFDAFEPDVAASEKEFFVVWRGDHNANSQIDNEYEIFGMRVDTTGVLQGSMITVSDMGTSTSEHDTQYGAFTPAITYNFTQHQYLVAWSGDDNTVNANDEFEIFVQPLSDVGDATGLSNDVKISDMGADGLVQFQAFAPDVAWNSTSDGYLVTWYGDDSISPLVNDEMEVFMQFLTSSGLPTGSNDVRVSFMGTNGVTDYNVANPAIAYNKSSNNYLIVWYGEHATTAENEIYGRTVASGGGFGTMTRFSDMGNDGSSTWGAFNPAIAHDPNLNLFLVTWQGDDNVSTIDDEFEIFGQLVTGAGAESGTDMLLTDVGGLGTSAARNAARPAVAYGDFKRDFVIVYDADDDFPGIADNEFEIFGQRFAEKSSEPANQTTNLTTTLVTSTSLTASFPTAVGTPDGYIVLRGGSGNDPVDQTAYAVGNTINSALVVHVGSLTTFNQSGLTSGTEYSYRVYSYNGVQSSLNYNIVSPFSKDVFTEPTSQATTLAFKDITTSGFSGSYQKVGTDLGGYLVVRKTGSALVGKPVDGKAYVAGDTVGTGGEGIVVSGLTCWVGGSGEGPPVGTPPPTILTSFTQSGLTAAQTYHFTVFAYAYDWVTCSTVQYKQQLPLRGQVSTYAVEPANQPTLNGFSSVQDHSFTVKATPAGTYIALRKTGSAVLSKPMDGKVYNVGDTVGVGGDATVVYKGSDSSFPQTSLTDNTIYHYSFFSYSGTNASSNYKISPARVASQATLYQQPPNAPSAMVFSSIANNSMTVAFDAASGVGGTGGYIALRKVASAVTAVPLDGKAYAVGDTVGTGGNAMVVFVGNSTTFNSTGLTHNTLYHYSIFSYNGSGAQVNYLASPLSSSQTTLDNEPIAAPATVEFSEYDNTTFSFKIAFATATGSPTGYLVVRRAGAQPTAAPEDGKVYALNDDVGNGSVVGVGSATSYTQANLTSGTEYFYSIYSFNGNGAATNYQSVPKQASSLSSCAAPVLNDASQITQLKFTASWPAVTGAGNYVVDVSLDENFNGFIEGYDSKTVSSTSVEVNTLNPGRIHYVRVRAANAAGFSVNSSPRQVLVVPGTPVPGVPSEITQKGFRIEWPNVTGATGYQVDVSTSDVFAGFVTGYQLKDVAANFLVMTDLSDGIKYYVRVRAVNASGASVSSPATIQQTLPATPKDLVIDPNAITYQSIKIAWGPATGAVSYELEVSSDDFKTFVRGYNPKEIKNATQEVVDSLEQKTTYKFRLRSKNTVGYSPRSDAASAQTKEFTIQVDPLKINTNPVTATVEETFQTMDLVVNVTGGTGPKKVVLKYKGILATNFSSADGTLKAGDEYKVSISKSMLDELGMEYRFEVTDDAKSPVTQSANSFLYWAVALASPPKIPFAPGMDGTSNTYQMFSVPYKLQDETITNLFDPPLKGADKTKWRLYHFENNANAEYPDEVKKIEIGKGYWFNTRITEFDIKLGAASMNQATRTKPFTIQLEKGWNQIGNPFPFKLSWTAVKKENTGLGNLHFFSGGNYVINDTFGPWTGAFVHAEEATTLTIPVTAKATGQSRITGLDNDIDEAEWQLPIVISAGSMSQQSGIGMHPLASDSKDEFDEITVPRFIDYVELNTYHREYFSHLFSTDVVSSSDNRTWMFNVRTNVVGEAGALSWNADMIQDAEASLILIDMTGQTWIDMKRQGSYSFVHSRDREIKIVYSRSGEFQPGVGMLGSAYPNPFAGTVTIPVLVDHTKGEVQISIYDALGRKIRDVSRVFNKSGIGYIEWDGRDNAGQQAAPGMLFYRLNGTVKTGRFIKINLD
ncbi:MAG TPA: T9SS type A sorting domain-containing protein [Cyclobacteriaceae bacterium]|nr:T9SS type A sorting domain-containing protein [Cyclobacteriaceae bacterium]